MKASLDKNATAQRRTGPGSLNIEGVPADARESLTPILLESFKGIYLWHARRTLRSVRWVRKATQGSVVVGLAMSTMLGEISGYAYYAAVTPSQRAKGVGGFLLDDALELLQAYGAREVFACVRAENTPGIRLLQSRGFARTGFSDVARSKGLATAARLWIKMVVAPGERVFAKILTDRRR